MIPYIHDSNDSQASADVREIFIGILVVLIIIQIMKRKENIVQQNPTF